MSSEVKFCALDRMSQTNPVSNLTILNGIDLSEDLLRIVEGRLDAARIPLILHEYTHHKCLSSAVGNALALLHIMAQRYAWETNETRDRFFAGYFARYYTRYYCAAVALRPLFEGVALFAEYDAWPGDSGVLSLPMAMAQLIASLFYPDPFTSDIFAMKLQMGRAECIPKKADLFTRPLGSKDGGYFLGYSLVRSTWLKAISRDSFFVDPDAFLAYLMEIAFGDYALVRILLETPEVETDIRVQELPEAICKRVVARLDGFFDSPDLAERRKAGEEYKKRFRIDAHTRKIQYVGTGAPEYNLSSRIGQDVSGLLFNDPVDARMGVALLENLVRSAEKELNAGAQQARDGLRFKHIQLFNRRKFFWLGTLPVTWERENGNIIISGNGMTLTIRSFQIWGKSEQVGNGTLEVVGNFTEALLATVLVAKDCKILIGKPDQYSDEQLGALFQVMDQRPELELWDSEVDSWLDATMAQWLSSDAAEKIVDTCQQVADTILRPASVRGIVKTNEETFIQLASKFGLFTVFGLNGELVRLVATASYLSACSPTRKHFQDGLTRLGYSQENVTDINATFKSRFGCELISLSEDAVFSKY